MKQLQKGIKFIKVFAILIFAFKLNVHAQMGYIPGLLHGGCSTSNVNPPQLISTTTINSALSPLIQYTIQQDVDIVGNVLFDNIEMYVPYTTKFLSITVKTGSTLTIRNSHVYGCSEMWQGIIVESGAHLIIEQNSLIEDAITAVELQPYSGITYPVNNVLSVKNTTFNRNWIAIKVTGYNLNADVPIVIANTTFTCRFIPFTPGSLIWPSFNTIRTSVNTNAGFPYGSQYIDDNLFYENASDPHIDWYTKLSKWSGIPLIMAGKKPLCGINLNACGKSCYAGLENAMQNEFAITSISDYFINVGLSNDGFNLFDNVQIGLLSYGSTVKVQNDVFQNMIPDKKAQPQGQFSVVGNYSGTGILADCDFINNIEIIPGSLAKNEFNHFIDCTRGVVINNYSRLKVKGNVFESAQDLSSLTNFEYDVQANPGFHYGKQGLLVQSNGYYNYDIDSNSFTNIESGIIGLFKPDPLNSPFLWVPCPSNMPAIHTFNFSCGEANIFGNNIKSLPQSFNGQFVNHGITWSVGYRINEDWHQPVNRIKVQDNILTNVYRGIEVDNWLDSKILLKDNLCNMVPDNMFAFNTEQAGIRLGNCQPGGNFKNEIVGNLVTIANGNSLFNNGQEHAIKVDNSILTYVSCNDVRNTIYGITFANLCDKSELFSNEFTNNQSSGLLLDQCNIGYNWGIPTKPADNKWLGSNWNGPGNLPNMVFSNNCSAQTAPMFVRPNLPYNPDGFCFSSSAFLFDYYDFGNNLTLFPTAPVNNISTCSPGILSNPGNEVSENSSNLQSILLGQNIVDTVFMNEIIAQNQINTVGQVIEFLASNTDSTLSNFIQENSNSAVTIDSFRLFSEGISSINATSLIPDSIYSNTQLAYLEYYRIKELLKNLSITSIDSMLIASYAFSCPKINGDVVYLYRDLLNVLTHHTNIYLNDCSINAARTAEQTLSKNQIRSNIMVEKVNKLEFSLFPIPTVSSLSVHVFSKGSQKQIYQFAIINSFGQIVRNGLIEGNEKQLDSKLFPGNYFFKLINLSNNETVTKPFVVIN